MFIFLKVKVFVRSHFPSNKVSKLFYVNTWPVFKKLVFNCTPKKYGYNYTKIPLVVLHPVFILLNALQ